MLIRIIKNHVMCSNYLLQFLRSLSLQLSDVKSLRFSEVASINVSLIFMFVFIIILVPNIMNFSSTFSSNSRRTFNNGPIRRPLL